MGGIIILAMPVVIMAIMIIMLAIGIARVNKNKK